ncbi:MAG: MgtC/SapB family protein, partial [Romboutsia timonensis]
YVLSICAWSLVMITLYILKKIDKIIFKKKQTIFSVKVDNINVITMLYNIFQKSQISVKNIDIENVEDIYWKLSFFIVYDRRIILDELVNELNNSKNIISVDYLH